LSQSAGPSGLNWRYIHSSRSFIHSLDIMAPHSEKY